MTKKEALDNLRTGHKVYDPKGVLWTVLGWMSYPNVGAFTLAVTNKESGLKELGPDDIAEWAR